MSDPREIDCLHCAIKKFIEDWCAAHTDVSLDDLFDGVIIASLAQVMGQHIDKAFTTLEFRACGLAGAIRVAAVNAKVHVNTRTGVEASAVEVTGMCELPEDPAHGATCGCLRCAIATAMNGWSSKHRDGALQIEEAAEALEWCVAQIVRGTQPAHRSDVLATIMKGVAEKSGFGAEKVEQPASQSPAAMVARSRLH